jgi:plasmid stabilization system protein ParE
VKQYTVVFSPEAQDHLTALYRHIAVAASPETAERYTNAIVTYCENLNAFPNIGTCRDDVRIGLRITHYKKRAVIAFAVDAERVSIIGVYYGGQNYESDLQFDSGD